MQYFKTGNKTALIIATTVMILAVIALIISVSVTFAPKSLDNILSTENIDYIKVELCPPDLLMTGEVEKVEKTLSQEESEAFIQAVKEGKYTARGQSVKADTTMHTYIYYKNGDVIELCKYRMILSDKDGNTKELVEFRDLDFDFSKAYGEDVMARYEEIINKQIEEMQNMPE